MTLLNYLHNHRWIKPNLAKVTGNFFFFHFCGIENLYENIYQMVFDAMWFFKIKPM